MTKLTAENIVSKVLDALNDRGGFDGWWGGIDDDIQQEIIEELVSIVEGEKDND